MWTPRDINEDWVDWTNPKNRPFGLALPKIVHGIPFLGWWPCLGMVLYYIRHPRRMVRFQKNTFSGSIDNTVWTIGTVWKVLQTGPEFHQDVADFIKDARAQKETVVMTLEQLLLGDFYARGGATGFQTPMEFHNNCRSLTKFWSRKMRENVTPDSGGSGVRLLKQWWMQGMKPHMTGTIGPLEGCLIWTGDSGFWTN